MRVNVYAEEMTDRVEIITKKVEGIDFTGVRFYLYLPVTLPHEEGGPHRTISGPFIHRTTAQGVDDDSSAVTFWGKRDLWKVLIKAIGALDMHYNRTGADDPWTGTWCPECGPAVGVDDEGLCTSCGATAVGEGAEAALRVLVSQGQQESASEDTPEPTKAPLSREALATVLALARGNTFGLRESEMGSQEAIEAVERYLFGEK